MSYIIESSIAASFLVGIILLIRLLLKNHMKKSIIYYLWFILLIKLIIPFGPESKLSVFNLVNVSPIEESNNSIIDSNTQVNNQVTNQTIPNDEINSDISTDFNSPVNNIVNDNNEQSNNFTYKEIISYLWISVASILILRGLIAYLKLHLSIKKEYIQYKNYDIDIDISKEKKSLSINRSIEVRVTNEINSPSLCGVIKPKILIPLKVVSFVNEKEMKYIIMHELCHYKRKDILVTWLTSIVKAIHWFNPIIYLGFNIMRSDCEAACDEMVLTKLGKEENLNYGNTIINVLQLIHSKNPIPGTTSMITDKKRLKDRIKNIAENKKFGFRTIIAGIVVIVILAISLLTTKLTTEKFDLVESTSIDNITITVMPSPPKAKIIDNKDDINKIVDYINSIEIKDKEQGTYKGYEVSINIQGKENYDISFAKESIYLNNVVYKVDKDVINEIKDIYNDLDYKETDPNLEKKEPSKVYSELLDRIKADGYEIVLGSGNGGTISMPSQIDTSSVLYEGLNKSLENGYDLSNYLGLEVGLYAFNLDISDGIQEAIGIVYEDKLVGYWISNKYYNKGEGDVYKILNELGVNDIGIISYSTVFKLLATTPNLKVEEKNKEKLATKDEMLTGDAYTVNINNEEVKIYEYSDAKAALSEIGIFNGDDYSEINYASDYILINIEELKSAKNVYFKNSIICLYNGDSSEIKDSLAKILGEPLVKQSRDTLRISGQDITLLYPSQWIGAQEPIELILGDNSYKIDSRNVKLNKNVSELKLNWDVISKELREFDGDYINIKWSDKLIQGTEKIFLTQISRNDFKRVVKTKAGYIDSDLFYPVIETTSTDKVYIGQKLYEEYIKMSSTDLLSDLDNGINKDMERSLVEYRIISCDLHSEGNNIFTVTVAYDIKPNESGFGLVGNGVDGDDGWIIDKFSFVDVEKIGENKYRMITAYTG
ncbi:M56 family metallopeptidase [Clostridium sp.]|uniref:M56 family metallopeptidase n=1 Tax=Clostridium sp. TaxID=1506 RepID=UPI001DD635FD|nr:M56 family metallopeptidase [Clostridium sp.]MBS5939737.1 hypothetical protein [Clostridium sp.]